MKQIVLAVCLMVLGMAVNTVAFAQSQKTLEQTHQKQVYLNDLSFNSIIKQFYANHQGRIKIAEEDYQQLPAVLLTKQDYQKQIAIMLQDAIEYKNQAGEQRYLVVVEKPLLRDDNTLELWRDIEKSADAFIFKKVNNKYQLISRNDTTANFQGSLFSILNDISSLDIKPIGKNMMGIVIKSSYMHTGSEIEWLDIVLLSEDGIIRQAKIDNVGGGNVSSGFESKRTYTYSSTYKIIKTNDEYYPIQLKYKGTNFSYDTNKKYRMNMTSYFCYDKTNNEYRQCVLS